MTHDVPILRELVVLAGFSLVVLLVFQRLRIPAILGFMISGVLIGPGGFGLIEDPNLVQTLAEFGVVLLLFMVGLEFSAADLRRLGRSALVAGTLQVMLVVAVVAVALSAFGIHPARALFFGMLASLSSTAVVFKLLTDRLELRAPHGRLTTAVLIFQDLAAIVFLLATPNLGQWLNAGVTLGRVGLSGILGTLAMIVAAALAVVTAQRIFPWLVGRASRAGSRETFLFGVAVVALGAAYLTSRLGASLALGAFLAGLMLAGSNLRTQIAADVLPFRDILGSAFFIAIGMSLEPSIVLRHPGLVLASTLGLVVVKGLITLVALRAARTPLRVSVATSLTLAQVGEFSFVIAQTGAPSGLLGETGAQAFTAAAVFSLILTPFLVSVAPRWALALDLVSPAWIRGRGVLGREEGDAEEAPQSTLLSDHVVVAGAGLNGRNVARVLRAVRLPHVVVDLDPEAAQLVLGEGSQALLGDIARSLVQKQAGVPRARVMVLALSDPTATRHACSIARRLSAGTFIVVRTRYVNEIDELYALGANQVIPEEFETSIEIFTSVLREFHVATNIIEAQITVLRQERYGLLRGRKLPGTVVEQLDSILKLGTTDTFLLLQQSRAVGKTLGQLGLTKGGARLVAVVRAGEAITELNDDFALRVGDTLVLTGAHAEIERAFERLS
jgi:CPA2 family monovalent cation:H+ antiporter-2